MNNKIKLPEYTLYNGEKIPCIGLGTFGSDKCSADEIANAVKGAIDAGYTMFDCAACYGNEAEIDSVIAQLRQLETEKKNLESQPITNKAELIEYQKNWL